MCKPDRVEWADGTAAEYDRLIRVMADGGMAIQLNPMIHSKIKVVANRHARPRVRMRNVD